MQGCSGTGNVAFSSAIVTPDIASHLEEYDGLMDNEDMNEIQRYEKSDVRRVSKLGEGCFSNVFLVVGQSEKKQMALKCLDHKKIRSPQEFLSASRDLICEANMLSQLEHPNIVNLHGVCSTTVSESYIQDGEGYFMVLDVVKCTLRNRIQIWRNDPNSYKKRGIASRLMNKGHDQEKLNVDEMKDRITSVAYGVAEAMTYIHKRDIIMRNLKPENIGFNESTGKVCLFNFGSARYLEDGDHGAVNGTPNYLAPEVMRAGEYSFASDVYSFAMVLYEICSLRKLTPRATKPFTVHHGAGTALPKHNGFDSRPCLDCIPCRDTQYLIEDCWCSDPTLRPTFAQISDAISKVVLGKYGSGADSSHAEDRTVSSDSDAA
eukprot:CAMPEP_0113631322 /NCGR_PEP_ID=MMETSP0017_2-20120614/16276_1 /TAXON_ID=2856 /ORGANISM="Cylindrotheca closterium" /LENGTH=375 /DNA_ID=CAMNT_0000541825 /DNA_START=36 /DNA_END=1163 /DNA_ORIENTATION=+ /assembly_acc=CAM_ASM_000147